MKWWNWEIEKNPTSLLSLIRILSQILVPFKCQGQSLLCPQCCWLLVLLCLFSFCACIKGGTLLGDWLGALCTASWKERQVSAVHGCLIESSWWGLERGKTLLAKMFLGNSVVGWTWETMKSSWQLHELAVTGLRTACLPSPCLRDWLPAKESCLCSLIIVTVKRGGFPFSILFSATSRIFTVKKGNDSLLFSKMRGVHFQKC